MGSYFGRVGCSDTYGTSWKHMVRFGALHSVFTLVRPGINGAKVQTPVISVVVKETV